MGLCLGRQRTKRAADRIHRNGDERKPDPSKSDEPPTPRAPATRPTHPTHPTHETRLTHSTRRARSPDPSRTKGAPPPPPPSSLGRAPSMSGPLAMANSIRSKVSKQRKRYTEDGFNLDLTYIRDNLIAMGYPAEKLEGMYRNHIDDVVRFLESKHKDHYKIYNLCSERSYDTQRFQRRVATYPFNDHNPPKIELIQKFCEDVHSWLTADSENIAAVHCKAGKGRTGTMICCYLLYSGQFETAADALKFYGQERAHDQKGVTIPSQRRYVEYYATLLNMCLSERAGSFPSIYYSPPALHILELIMQPPPALNGGQGSLEFCIYADNNTSQKISISVAEARKNSTSIRIQLEECTPLIGDVKVEIYNKPKIIPKEKLFHFWFNTVCVQYNVNSVVDPTYDKNDPSRKTYRLTFTKWELDDAHKDVQHKIYHSDFMVQVVMQCVPENSWGTRTPAISNNETAHSASPHSSVGEESDGSLEPEEGWDSAVDGAAGGTGALLGHYRLLSEPELDNMPNNTSNAHTAASPPEVERMLHA